MIITAADNGEELEKEQKVVQGSSKGEASVPRPITATGLSRTVNRIRRTEKELESDSCDGIRVRRLLHSLPSLNTVGDMASLKAPPPSFLTVFLPVVRARLLPNAHSVKRIPLLQQLQQFRLNANLLPAALAPIPTLLGELWDGLLEAVPKKKTSHMKKRHRQMAGKALKDVTALNKCSACGRLKRAHILCPYCVQSIRQWFSNGFKSKEEVEQQQRKRFDEVNEERLIKGRKPLEWEKVYKDKKEGQTDDLKL